MDEDAVRLGHSRPKTHYLLVYQPKDDKSEFLAQAGYTLQNWERLRQDILRAVESAEIFGNGIRIQKAFDL